MGPSNHHSVHVLRVPPRQKLHVHEDEKGAPTDGSGEQLSITKPQKGTLVKTPVNFSQCIRATYMWWGR